MAASDAAILLIAGLYLAHVLTRQRLAASQERSFGDYHLTALIGQGAIGEVWRAEHELLVRPAAIKLVTPRGIAGEERAAAQRRFEREARVTALLTSPHTVTVYDYGLSDEGACYSVMELLEGEDLQRRVERAGPLSPEQTVAVALQVCDSLAEAHERGLVHRDLKPANLFMARIGCDPQFVKVLDFGIDPTPARGWGCNDPRDGSCRRYTGVHGAGDSARAGGRCPGRPIPARLHHVLSAHGTPRI
jgi:serine/threonine-protein kinase